MLAPNRKESPARRPHTTVDQPQSTEAEEPEAAQSLDIKWESSAGRCLFVVDCQPLQQIVCGHLALKNEEFRPLLCRLLDNILECVSQGWVPPTSTDDPAGRNGRICAVAQQPV